MDGTAQWTTLGLPRGSTKAAALLTEVVGLATTSGRETLAREGVKVKVPYRKDPGAGPLPAGIAEASQSRPIAASCRRTCPRSQIMTALVSAL